MKIAIYATSKEEAHNLDGWLMSCAGADYVVLADRGSEDGTGKKFAEMGYVANGATLISRPIDITPWRYDDAHNAVLAAIPDDADICIPLQLDERLLDNWSSVLEKAWTPKTTRLSYTYIWDAENRIMQNRIHARHGYRWRYPVHAGVYPDRITEVQTTCPDLVIRKFMNKKKASRTSTFDLLQVAVKENPHSARMAYYLGREYFYKGRFKEAIPWLQKYDDLEGGWALERAENYECLAKCLRAIAS